jgi:protein-S-isoprenylcysteine O-methyltransferase Ste14
MKAFGIDMNVLLSTEGTAGHCAIPAEREAPDVAHADLVRPRFVYLAAILIGSALQIAWPLHFLPPRIAPLGAVLIAAGAALFVMSVRQFRAADTPVAGDRPSTAVVERGPYRFSRNPIYMAFSLLQLGIATSADSVWLVATLAGAVAVVAFVAIPREERYMARKFGAPYLDYKRRVRRWV